MLAPLQKKFSNFADPLINPKSFSNIYVRYKVQIYEILNYTHKIVFQKHFKKTEIRAPKRTKIFDHLENNVPVPARRQPPKVKKINTGNFDEMLFSDNATAPTHTTILKERRAWRPAPFPTTCVQKNSINK